MRLSRKSIQQAVAGVAVAGVAVGTAFISSSAQAGVSYDLRYAPDSLGSGPGITDPLHQHTAAAGTYHLELWERVSGTNATTTDEYLSNSFNNIVSTQVSGGAITDGGLANGQNQAPFNDAATSRNGTANNISADGIGDWGGTDASSSTGFNNTAYMFSRSTLGASGGTPGGGSVGQAVNASTWEFKIATFDLVVNAVNSGAAVGAETQFHIMQPAFTKQSITNATYSAARSDSLNDNVSPTNAAAVYGGSSGVSLLAAVPEPSALGLLGIGAVGLISRKRRK